jgi:hypothetical protein
MAASQSSKLRVRVRVPADAPTFLFCRIDADVIPGPFVPEVGLDSLKVCVLVSYAAIDNQLASLLLLLKAGYAGLRESRPQVSPH